MRKIPYGFAALCLTLFCLGAAGISVAAEPQTHKNSIGMEFVLIQAGSFMMGTDPNFEESRRDEWPQHQVTLSKPFYLGKYEVTQAQWEAVMRNNPSYFKGAHNPVERVSWNDAQVFIRRLNQKEGHQRYRLPTEAEWEYAARAGTGRAWFFGNDQSKLSGYGWYSDNSGNTTRPVGRKQPNPWGLYDVHGNVWEWVQDWYAEKYYANSPGTDPKGPASGSYRVYRGGSWSRHAGHCRSGYRDNASRGTRFDGLGFRLALSPE